MTPLAIASLAVALLVLGTLGYLGIPLVTNRIVYLALCLLVISLPCHAQTFRIRQSQPDCHLLERKWDTPFDYTHGVTQPRIAWHVELASAAYGVSALFGKIVPKHPWLDAVMANFAIGVAPHIAGIAQGRYPINPGDIAYDAVNRATPYIWAKGHTDNPQRSWVANHWKPFAIWLAADLSLACFSSP